MIAAPLTPGVTVWLAGGTYTPSTPLTHIASGTALAPITFRALPGQRAIVSQVTTMTASYITWRDVEFAWLNFADRTSVQGVPSPTDIDGSTLLVGQGTGNKIINCILHDGWDGYTCWSTTNGGEIYGCLVFYNGWHDDAGVWGHGIYAGHNGATQQPIEDNIVFSNFGIGMATNTENNPPNLGNQLIQGNISFENGILNSAYIHNHRLTIHGGASISGFVVQNNYYYCAGKLPDPGLGLWIRGFDGGTVSVDFNNNVVVGPKALYLANLTEDSAIENNVIVGTIEGFVEADYPTNDYAASHAGVYVRPNKYESKRAHVAIYNPAGANSVEVDLTTVTGLAAGSVVKVHNVEDYWVDIQTLTLDANKKITVDMQAVNRTVQTPVGWSAPTTVFPNFGAFVVDVS